MEKENTLLAEKDRLQQQFDKVRTGYDELKTLLEKKSDEQVKDLYSKLDQERTTRDETNKQLLKSQAELQIAQDRIQKILKESVWPVQPPPDTEIKAFEPDVMTIFTAGLLSRFTTGASPFREMAKARQI
jgi:uncharacterized protein YPO0396